MTEKRFLRIFFYSLFVLFAGLAVFSICVKRFWLQLICWALAFLCKMVANRLDYEKQLNKMRF